MYQLHPIENNISNRIFHLTLSNFDLRKEGRQITYFLEASDFLLNIALHPGKRHEICRISVIIRMDIIQSKLQTVKKLLS